MLTNNENNLINSVYNGIREIESQLPEDLKQLVEYDEAQTMRETLKRLLGGKFIADCNRRDRIARKRAENAQQRQAFLAFVNQRVQYLQKQYSSQLDENSPLDGLKSFPSYLIPEKRRNGLDRLANRINNR